MAKRSKRNYNLFRIFAGLFIIMVVVGGIVSQVPSIDQPTNSTTASESEQIAADEPGSPNEPHYLRTVRDDQLGTPIGGSFECKPGSVSRAGIEGSPSYPNLAACESAKGNARWAPIELPGGYPCRQTLATAINTYATKDDCANAVDNTLRFTQTTGASGRLCTLDPSGSFTGLKSCTRAFGTPADCVAYPKFLICPGEVDDSVPVVKVRFTALQLPKKDFFYFYCLKSAVRECEDDDWEKIDAAELLANQNSEYYYESKELCGNGTKNMKTDCSKDGSDWFHTGSTYQISLAQAKKKENIGSGDVKVGAAFYVKHFYPEIVEPKEGGQEILNVTNIEEKPGGIGKIRVTLKGRNNINKNDSDNGGSNKFNDYWIEIHSRETTYIVPQTDLKKSCVYVAPLRFSLGDGFKADEGTNLINLPFSYIDLASETIQITPGSYVLRIKDGVDGNFNIANPECADGGFTLYDIPFSIGSTTDKGVRNLGRFGKWIKDPYGAETAHRPQSVAPIPVCTVMDANGYCLSIPTALGNFHTEPREFVGDIFSLVLSIAGVIAVIFFVQAGYTLMTSAGSKEKIGAAREQIISAIMGLIFIVLSITILEFIGINILRLPGFAN